MIFLITGGASGLGLSITQAVASRFPSSTIYFTFFSSLAAKEQLEADFKNTKGVRCDFNSDEDISSLVEFIRDRKPAVLVNNALTGLSRRHAHKVAAAEITDSFRADVLSVVKITAAFIEQARKLKSGKIITILSSSIASPPVGWSIYAANKNYLLSMHRSWVNENKSFNITSNCISPDFMQTPLHSDTDERVIEGMIAGHPLKKLLSPDDVAETVVFLSAAPSHLNGQNIILNAGQF